MTYSLQFEWQAEGDDEGVIAADRRAVEAALERLLTLRHFHNPTVFVRERPAFGPAEIPDHGLKLDLSQQYGVGALAYFGPADDANAYVTLATEAVANAPTLYKDIDSATPFPANAAISLDRVRAALIEFREKGGHRPTCVNWQPTDAW